MIREVCRNTHRPMKVVPGDRVNITYDQRDPATGKIIKSTMVASHEIDREMTFDTAIICEFTDEFGLKQGYIGVIGESNQNA